MVMIRNYLIMTPCFHKSKRDGIMNNQLKSNQPRNNSESSEQSEAQYRIHLDTIPAMVRVIDDHRRCVYVNRQWLEFTGREVSQEVGDGWIELIHPDDVERCLEIHRTTFEAREPFSMQYRMRHHNDGYRWVMHTGKPRFNEQNEFIGYIGSCTDINEQKESELLLKQSEEKYRSLFETMAQGVIYWDAEGRLLHANPAALKALGQSLESLQAWKPAAPEWHVIDEDGQPLAQDKQPAWVALRTGLPVTDMVMGVYNPMDQQFHWLHTNAIPQFHVGEDRPFCVYSTFDDITKRRQADNSLRFLFNATAMLNSTLDYETTLKNIAQLAVPQLADWCAIDMLEEDGSLRRIAVQHVDPEKVALAHEIWERWPIDMNAETGTPQVLRTKEYQLTPEITDEMVNAIPDPELREITQKLGLRSAITVPILAKDQALGVITLVSAESGRRYGHEEARFAQEIAHHAGLSIENARLFSDTQRMNAELEKRVEERTAELEATVKELEAFSYSVSHDLRAPLRTIDGFSRAILEDYAAKLDDEGKNYLDRVRLATQHMGQLIDDLLKLSRVTRGEMYRTDVNLSSIAQSSLTALQVANPSREVTIKIQENLNANGDAHLLRIVFDNLLSNAWKFTAPEDHPVIEVGSIELDGKTAYFVRDNGAGFDMAYIGKLFGAFQRLHSENEFKGSGIGLATVQRIIRRHGGTIWAEGEVGKGATFYFTL
jgi:PAS domain S-box-containing protein